MNYLQLLKKQIERDLGKTIEVRGYGGYLYAIEYSSDYSVSELMCFLNLDHVVLLLSQHYFLKKEHNELVAYMLFSEVKRAELNENILIEWLEEALK